MTKQNATDKQLGELHGRLAEAMLRALDASEAAAALIEEYAAEMPGAVLEYMSKQAAASPALLTAIAKFLKDNDITCAVEDSEQMTDLQRRLENKQRKRVGNVTHLHEDE